MALVVVGCGDSDEPASGPAKREVVTVFTPPPLQPVLGEVAKAFERAHPDTTMRFNSAHMPSLVSQLEQGLRTDLFATPDIESMKQVESAGQVVERKPFARNQLVIVVPSGNPDGIKGVADLADPRPVIALCARELPCGRLTEQLLRRTGTRASADSSEAGGSPAVVSKVATGDVDAGLAFSTDVSAAAGKVEAVTLPVDQRVSVEIPLATLSGASQRAKDFVAFLGSEEGLRIIERFGFLRP